jgi:hypothetical protein
MTKTLSLRSLPAIVAGFAVAAAVTLSVEGIGDALLSSARVEWSLLFEF